MLIPSLPFASDRNVSELVQFSSAWRDQVYVARVHPHSSGWIRGRDQCLERRVMRAVRSAHPQLPSLKATNSGALKHGGRLQDEGHHGPDVFEYAVRILGTV